MAEKLYYACKGGQVSLVNDLLSEGSRRGLNERVYDNQLGFSSTPLHAAVKGGHSQIVEKLLMNGANPSLVDEEDMSPLTRACELSKVPEAIVLLKYGARPYDDNPENYTRSPWHKAIMNDQPDLVGAMLDQNSRLVEAHGPTKWNGLHYASQNGKTKAAEVLIKRKSSVDVPINTGRTALHLAAFQGHSAILKFLLDANANPNIKSGNPDGGWTPLILASQEGKTECVRFLLADRRINVQLRAKNGRNALHSCSFHGHFEIAKMLVDKGIDAHVEDENGWTQLHLCCQEKHFKVVEYILNKGKKVDPTSKAKNGRTPLHSASLKGNHEAVAMLLKFKALKIDEPDSRNWTPLHVACQNGRTECARLLLNAGASPNCQIESGRNTLHLVAFEGYTEIARMLMDKGVDYKQSDSQQWTPLHLCTQEGKTEIALMILEKDGVPLNAQAHNGRTSLHSASYNGRTEVARVLIQKGANVMIGDKDGWTALHLAAQQGHAEIVRMLVGGGALVNKQSKNERTPLHLAAMKGHKDIVVYLLNQGADQFIKDCKRWIPLHVASNHNFADIVRILLDRGSPVDDMIDMGRSSLHLAAFNGHTEVVNILLERGATVDLADKDHWTSLHLACQEGKLGVVRKLLERGASVHAKANNGRTPLHSAVTSGVIEIVQDVIGRGADLSARMNDGQSPLHTAVLYKQAEVVSVLLDKGAPLGNVKNNGDTALHVAANEGLTEICQILLNRGIDRNIVNNNGSSAVMIARNKGNNSIANLIQNFVQTQPIPPPVITQTAQPGNKIQTLFVAFGPNEVQGGEEVTLRVYCIDATDSTAKDDVYHFERQGDRVPWGPPCRCLVPTGEQVDLSIERCSANFILSKDSFKQSLDSEWVGFTSSDFEIDVGNPAANSREDILLRVLCRNSKLTDMKIQWKVKAAQGIPVNDVEPPPYPMEPPTFSDNPPAYPTPQKDKGELSIPPAPNMTEGKFIFVSYSSHDKGLILPIVCHLLEEGIPVWLDIQQIAPGEMWDEQLGFALRNCKGVLCCLSDNWFESINCKTELRAVRRRIELRDNIPANSIWPIVIGQWNGHIPDDCYYNLSGDSTQRLDFTIGPEKSEPWLSSCKILSQRMKKFLEAL